MKYVAIIAVALATASAQVVHELPFASNDNTLELTVENTAGLAASNTIVEVVRVPHWIHLTSMKHDVGRIPARQEAVASLTFSVDRSAPVGVEETLSFAVVNESGQRWSKEIRVSVASPADFSLFQNYPNPFNPATIVGYQLAAESKVRLCVYDLLGREVSVLAEGNKSAGYHEEVLSSAALASGMYILRLVASQYSGKEFVAQRAMTVLK